MKIYKINVGLYPLNPTNKNVLNLKKLNDVIVIIDDNEDLFRFVKANYIQQGWSAIITDSNLMNDFFASNKILQYIIKQ